MAHKRWMIPLSVACLEFDDERLPLVWVCSFTGVGALRPEIP